MAAATSKRQHALTQVCASKPIVLSHLSIAVQPVAMPALQQTCRTAQGVAEADQPARFCPSIISTDHSAHMPHCSLRPSHSTVRAANSCGSLSSCRSISHRAARQARPLRIYCWACPQQEQSALPSPYPQGALYMRLPCTIRQAPYRCPLHLVPAVSSFATPAARALACWPLPRPWHRRAGQQQMLPEAGTCFMPLQSRAQPNICIDRL